MKNKISGVRILATKLVEQWLKIAKGEKLPNQSPNKKDNLQLNSQNAIIVKKSTMFVDQNNEAIKNTQSLDDPLAISSNDNDSDNIVEDKENSSENSRPDSNEALVFKITVKDGKQVLAKVHDQSPKKNSNNSSSKQSDLRDIDSDNSSEISSKSRSRDSSYSSSKRQRDSKSKSESRDKDRDRKDREKDKDRKSSSSHRSSSSSSKSLKHNSSSSSSSKITSSKSSSSSSKHRSSGSKSSDHKSSGGSSPIGRDKEKHRSSSSSTSKSSSGSSSTKDKVKSESAKLSQAEKDKDTLAKLLPQSVSKIGKIPKKVPINDDKMDTVSGGDEKVRGSPPKKPSISIEVRKDTENRPKTVKTFHSQFRSHGLAEEAPPPPSRKALKKPGISTTSTTSSSTTSTPGITAVKRSLSPTNNTKYVEKKIKMTSPTTEKPGGIKLIPAKPKRKHISLFQKLISFLPFRSQVLWFNFAYNVIVD